MKKDHCKNCNKAGLAILPVRYAVVPRNMAARLPAALKAPRVKSEALQTSQYALRSLRQGFVYVFYEKRWIPLGDGYANLARAFEVYSVADDGSLWRQPSAMGARATPDPLCSDAADYAPASVIAIANPEKAGTVWIAFSEYKWSLQTLDRYGNDAKQRGRRMQKVVAADWIATRRHDDGYEATVAGLQEIVEYHPQGVAEITPYPADFRLVQANRDVPAYTYSASAVDHVSSRYPVYTRQRLANHLAAEMTAIGKKDPAVEPYPPMVLALWDAVGTAHELNGFRNEAVGWQDKFSTELALEFTAYSAIAGARAALEKGMMESIDHIYERGKEVRHVRIDEQHKRADLLYRADPRRLFLEYEKIDAEEIKRDANYEKARKNQGASAWRTYAAKLDQAKLDAFDKCYQRLLAQGVQRAQERTPDVVTWCKSPLLHDTLGDYQEDNWVDGAEYNEVVGEALFGLSSTPNGSAFLNELVAKVDLQDKSNLIWRAMALNQKEAKDMLAETLAQVDANRETTGEAAAALLGQIKFNKLEDTYKKFVALSNTNAKAITKPESGLKAVSTGVLLSADKLMMTAGDAMLKWSGLRAVTDGFGELVVWGMLATRAGVSATAVADVMAARAKWEGPYRRELVKRIRLAKGMTADSVKATKEDFKELARAYRKLREDTGLVLNGDIAADHKVQEGRVKSATSIRDMRLALLLGLLEGMNLYKLSMAAHGDDKTRLKLKAAWLATSAATLDVVATSIKLLAKAGDESKSFQLLKPVGGILGCWAGFIGAGLDWDEGNKFKAKEKSDLAFLYYSRSAVQYAASGLSLFVSISYAGPMLKALGQRQGAGWAHRVVGWFGGRLLAGRAMGMLLGLGATIAWFGTTGVICLVEPGELENWCEKSAFGKLNQADRFHDSEEQMNAFAKAISEVE